jgi:hypothetical protein
MNFLKGYKTYIVAAAAILTALGAYLNESISLTQFVEACFAGVGTMTLRGGIKNDVAKRLGVIALCAATLSFASCANLGNIEQTLGTPAAVQVDITLLGAIAKPHVPTDAQAKIHEFATVLNGLADLNLDTLFLLLPQTTGSQNGDALISAAKAYLTSVVQKYGHNNATTLAYAHAVANGLLANF